MPANLGNCSGRPARRADRGTTVRHVDGNRFHELREAVGKMGKPTFFHLYQNNTVSPARWGMRIPENSLGMIIRRNTFKDVLEDAFAAGSRYTTGPVNLSCHDILVLKVLAEHRGEVVRRIDIVEEVCGLNSEATLRTVDNHIVALRRAIGDDPHRPRWLHTVRGEGYRLTRADNG